ncbi:hypothetical protein SAMN04487783_1731 [Agrococcus baldri]|uniref:Uncharacterized protein n=2 Tax=Agrococcus baldri TaxID=153730 RepID=A0AA94HNS0_9MICO|nr:hypothetical protein SAMN04487783_1731 [Agrococcus baldri]
MLVLLADWWWVAPAGAGAGGLGWAVQRVREPAGRRLAVDAARHDLRQAQRAVVRTRAQVKVASAEVLRTQADRESGHGGAGAVPEAKRRLQQAQRQGKAAVAELRARRASLAAARATIPASSAPLEAMPLARLRAEHDALTQRWIAYETDPAQAIEYPAMSDPSSPVLREFLRLQRQAIELRPATTRVRMAPAEFAAYRDAVRAAARAFETAERSARSAQSGTAFRRDGTDWSALVQDLLETAQDVIERSVDGWQHGGRRRRHPDA